MVAPPSKDVKAANQKTIDSAKASQASNNNGPQNANNPGGKGPQSSSPSSSKSQGSDSKSSSSVKDSAAKSMADQQKSQPSGRTPSDSQLSRADTLPASRISTSLNNRNPTLGNTDPAVQYGVGTAKQSPIQYRDPQINGRNQQAISSLLDTIKAKPVALDPSIAGRNQQAIRNEVSGPGGGVPGGARIVAYEGGPVTPRAPAAPGANQDFTSPEQEAELDRIAEVVNRIALDPSIMGRNKMANRPGAGVPDLPTTGQTINKTPGPRVNLPASPPGPGTINDLLNGIQSGWDQPDIADPRLSYPSDEGQIYSPADLAQYPGVAPKIQDRIATRASLSPGQILGNQTVNDAIHPASNLNASRVPASAPPAGGVTYGPETPAGPEGWQTGDNIDPANYTEPEPGSYDGPVKYDDPRYNSYYGDMKVAGYPRSAAVTNQYDNSSNAKTLDDNSLQRDMDNADPFAEPENDLYGRRTGPQRVADKITEKFEKITDPVQRLVESIFGKPTGQGRQPSFGQGGQGSQVNPVIPTPAGNTDLMTLVAEMQGSGLAPNDQLKLILSVFA